MRGLCRRPIEAQVDSVVGECFTLRPPTQTAADGQMRTYPYSSQDDAYVDVLPDIREISKPLTGT